MKISRDLARGRVACLCSTIAVLAETGKADEHHLGNWLEFVCRIASPTTIGDRPGIVPIISGRAWITAVSQYMLDPVDPWPVRLPASDAWPRVREAI